MQGHEPLPPMKMVRLPPLPHMELPGGFTRGALLLVLLVIFVIQGKTRRKHFRTAPKSWHTSSLNLSRRFRKTRVQRKGPNNTTIRAPASLQLGASARCDGRSRWGPCNCDAVAAALDAMRSQEKGSTTPLNKSEHVEQFQPGLKWVFSDSPQVRRQTFSSEQNVNDF